MAKAKKQELQAIVPVGDEPTTSGKGGEPSRVMYIGRIPHGFYEDQLRGYFEQFGAVSRVRLSRCKKTGRSKHYAFLEFATPEIAGIVADAMDGYIMLKQKLQCRVLNKEEVHADLWRGANRRFRRIPWAKVEAKRHNRERTDEEEAKRLERALSRDKRRAQKLRKLGIEYDYAPLTSASAAAPAAAAAAVQGKQQQKKKQLAAAAAKSGAGYSSGDDEQEERGVDLRKVGAPPAAAVNAAKKAAAASATGQGSKKRGAAAEAAAAAAPAKKAVGKGVKGAAAAALTHEQAKRTLDDAEALLRAKKRVKKGAAAGAGAAKRRA